MPSLFRVMMSAKRCGLITSEYKRAYPATPLLPYVLIIIDGGRGTERSDSIYHLGGHEVDVGLGAFYRSRLSVSTTQMSGI